MPKLWEDTIDAHRRAVRDAALDAAAALVGQRGLRGVTMSQIAQESGIGRATLYKYFPDVESILLAWHERQIGSHLEQLAALRERTADPRERLEAVLEAYALVHHEVAAHHAPGGLPRHGTDLAALLHRGEHVERAQQHVRGFVRDVLREAAEAGVVRDDVSPDELAVYCLQALGAAADLPSKAAVRRLVDVTLTGLRTTGG